MTDFHLKWWFFRAPVGDGQVTDLSHFIVGIGPGAEAHLFFFVARNHDGLTLPHRNGPFNKIEIFWFILILILPLNQKFLLN